MISHLAILIFVILVDVPVQECIFMEATMQVESEDIQMTAFLDRFKKFIALSHRQQQNHQQTDMQNTYIGNFIQTNDTFQANYDFAQNLLTVNTNYSLLLNDTNTKVSDVKIIVTFKFKQSSEEKILLEDLHGHEVPNIGLKNRFVEDQSHSHSQGKQEFPPKENNSESTILSSFISFIVNFIEPIIITFIQIVINGVLGHTLTSVFDQLYHGQLNM